MWQRWKIDSLPFLVLVIMVLLSACQSVLDMADVPGTSHCTVGLYAGDGAQTRTTMLSNGLSAVWDDGDEIAVWALDATGNYTLTGQVFTSYGLDGRRGFFTSTLSSSMPEDNYTYYCCYPVPASVNGTQVTFVLPSEQDGKVTGGADIMIAAPVQHGALTSIPDPEDHSGLSMQMNRMMHQFRFWLPEGYDVFNGEPVEEIILTMPQNIAGTVTADVAAPASAPSLSSGSATMSLILSEPITTSADLDDASFACASVFPYSGTYTDSDYMNLVLYSQRYKAVPDPVALSGRTFVSGHSTPVRLLPAAAEEYYRLTMKVRDNHIGEPLLNVQIAFNGSEWYRYTNATEEGDGNFTHSVEALGTDGKAAYDLIVSSIESGVATYTYETEHALVERPLTADMMTYDGNKIVLDLGDVPYLLEEDFTNALATEHADEYKKEAISIDGGISLGSDQNVDGYLLDGYMPLNGWNAARYKIFEGDLIRINCRYESGAWVVGRYCGRLDTPSLKYLKDGVSVNVTLEFDEAFYVPEGYNRDDSGSAQARYVVGYHTNSESSAIDGQNQNDVSGEATIIYTSEAFASEDVTNMHSRSLTVSSAGSSTRIVFFATTDRSTSVVAANSIYYLYLDNIKVYIQN